MKREFVLIKRRGARHYEIALGHDTPPRQRRDFVKRLRINRGDSPYEEVAVARVVQRHRLVKGKLDSVEQKRRQPNETAKPKAKQTGPVAAVKKAATAVGDFLLGK